MGVDFDNRTGFAAYVERSFGDILAAWSFNLVQSASEYEGREASLMYESGRAQCRMLFTLSDGSYDCALGTLNAPFPGNTMIYLNGTSGWYSLVSLVEFKLDKVLMTPRTVDDIWAGKLDALEWQAALLRAHAPELFQMFAPNSDGGWRAEYARTEGVSVATDVVKDRSFTLSTPELETLTRHLVGSEYLAEPNTPPNPQEAEARVRADESLLQQGLIQRTEGNEIAIDKDLAALLTVSIWPDVVCILRVSAPDTADSQRYFSFAQNLISYNYMDERGQHIFTPLGDLDVVVDEMLLVSGVRADQQATADGGNMALETLLPRSKSISLLTVVRKPSDPEPQTNALSWITADNGLWLVGGEGSQEAPTARAIDRPQLAQSLRTAIGAAFVP